MSVPDTQVLSEHFRQRLEGRELLAAVFCTYQFDPGFFEQQILPVFLNAEPHLARKIRLVQLEQALSQVEEVAVYYDVNGLVAGAESAAHLDVRRIPVWHPRGIFHPKLVFALVRERTAQGQAEEMLLVAALSANLTLSGWWENVEACHVEEIRPGDKLWMRDALMRYLRGLPRLAQGRDEHKAVDRIHAFLKDRTEERLQRSQGGLLQTHFLDGNRPLPDELEEALGRSVRGWDLEVIAPFYDQRSTCKPLQDLVDRFQPRRIQLMLPLADDGTALVDERIHAHAMELGAQWAELPAALVKRPGGENRRTVHAKVYRFFDPGEKREVLYIGSANMTTAAHQRGNAECGLLLERWCKTRPAFWTTPVERPIRQFEARDETGDTAKGRGSALMVRYLWDQSKAQVYWAGAGTSPALELAGNGVRLVQLGPVPSGAWTDTDAVFSERLQALLATTSIVEVIGEREEPVKVLVQEEGMAKKPSLLMDLTAEEILRYWSMLTAAQRAAFIEAHASEAFFQAEDGADLMARAGWKLNTSDSLFDRFAGIYHAFDALEKAVAEALDDGRAKRAVELLFGRKFDSLGQLLDRIEQETSDRDAVHRYVLVQCARQLLRTLRRDQAEWCAEQAGDVRAMDERLKMLWDKVRGELVDRNNSENDMERFMDWFDKWFMPKAERINTEA